MVSILGSSFLHNILFGFFSYIFEDKRGVFPECEFVYDLELPSDYIPVNSDGEVGTFELMNMEQVRSHQKIMFETTGWFGMKLGCNDIVFFMLLPVS